MTREQIFWQIVIGLFLLGVGAVLRPLFKGVWTRMNRPRPLSPSEKGSLLTQITMQEDALERLNHFSTHTKDLFLYLFRLAMTALLFFISAVCLYVYRPTVYSETFPLVFILVLSTFIVCAAGIWEATRMSDKNIDALKESVKKSIDEAK